MSTKYNAASLIYIKQFPHHVTLLQVYVESNIKMNLAAVSMETMKLFLFYDEHAFCFNTD